MTLSGRAAEQRPDIDLLAAVPLGIVTHVVRHVGPGGMKRLSAGPGALIGHVVTETGAYRAAVGQMTDQERREAGLRRNGQPRRRTDVP
jgi:hypothetical protein